jgi:hypothetical protein
VRNATAKNLLLVGKDPLLDSGPENAANVCGGEYAGAGAPDIQRETRGVTPASHVI